jgi:hypothetical protein
MPLRNALRPVGLPFSRTGKRIARLKGRSIDRLSGRDFRKTASWRLNYARVDRMALE